VREVGTEDIAALVCRLYQEANFDLPPEVMAAYEAAAKRERSPLGREVLHSLMENARIAAADRVPLCQDTGVAVVFVRAGQEVVITGGDLAQAVDEGIARAVDEGYLRASMVSAPCFERKNTGDNTPAVLHVQVVAGDSLEVTVLPKGAGSENVGRLGMLRPAAGAGGVADFVVETVERGGARACPPLFLGVGVGGTMDKAALLAKEALLRPAGEASALPRLAELEAEILERVNGLGIGPGGYGGTVTCLGVAIEDHPCHIASLPVAVNIQCHSARKARGVL
jgi:fumarate hydratase subunit alpha